MKYRSVGAPASGGLPGLQDLKSLGVLMWRQIEDIFADNNQRRRMMPTRWRNGMRFVITGKQTALTRSNKPCEIWVGIWVDRSRYTGAKLRALRKERGCARPILKRAAA